MKQISCFLCIAASLIFSTACYSQKVVAPYEVGKWQGFCSVAVSYTFDDNCPNQLSIAVPMFNEFGFTLTLFTVTTTSSSWSWMANWAGLQAAASQGHEIASHTITHTDFTGMAAANQIVELRNSKDTIEARIPGKKCSTIAYPYCNRGIDSLVRQYYFAARGCSGQTVFPTPSDFMNISSMVCGTQGINSTASFNSTVDGAVSNKKWCVYLIHGINGTEPGAYSPINADIIRASLEYLKASPDKFWVSTFGNVAKYIRERNSISLTETSSQDSIITLQAADTLDNTLYDVPVTLRRPLPANWSSAIATQNAKSIKASVVEINSVKYVMFDVVPDAGEIKLIKDGTTGIEDHLGSTFPARYSLDQNFPNPFNPETEIKYQLPMGSFVSLKIFDVLGREVTALVNEYKNAGMYTSKLSMQNFGLQSGIYFYRMQAGDFIQTKKMTLLK